VHEAFSHQGIRFDDLAAPAFARLLLLRVPAAVRTFEATAAAFRALKPALVCLENQAGGLGRPVVAAARAEGAPAVAIPPALLYSGLFRLKPATSGADPEFEPIDLPAASDGDLAPRLAALLKEMAAPPVGGGD
jgi:hypothetical protein